MRPASSWVLDGLALSARQLRLPASEPMPFTLEATLRPQGDASTTLAVVSLEGQASEASVSAKFELSSLSLAAVAPYVNAASHVQVGGTGAANGRFEWAAGTPSQAQRILVALDEVTLDGLTADDPKAGKAGRRGETVAMQRVQLAGVTVDLASQSIAVASARLRRPQVRLDRSADGVWNLMRLAGPTPLAESERALVRAAAEATWQFRLDDLVLEEGRVTPGRCRAGAGRCGGGAGDGAPVDRQAATGLAGPASCAATRLVSTPKLQLGARIADDREAEAAAKPGLVDWRGRFGLQPLLVAGKARIERFPVHAVQSLHAARPGRAAQARRRGLPGRGVGAAGRRLRDARRCVGRHPAGRPDPRLATGTTRPLAHPSATRSC